jgi:HD-GYP domain-containing protein (c-di-GMP phosphodiesterase class II)
MNYKINYNINEGIDLIEDMRILAVADVFDALRSERPYRPAL